MPAKPPEQDVELRGKLRAALAPHLGLAMVFSVAVNTLFLASPLYMMQLYGRVLNSRSLETLASLSVVLVLALAAMGAADAARGRLLARAASRAERRLAQATPEGAGRQTERLRDLGVLRGFLSGTGATTLCDAPFTILFLCLLFLLHPLLGLVATLGAVTILAAVMVGRWMAAARERRIAAGEAELRDLGGMLDADRGDLAAFGARPGLSARLTGGVLALGGLRQSVDEGSASVGAFTRTVRMIAHSAALAAGAVLTLDGQLAPAAMLAAAILAGRALGPMESLLGALRQAAAARAALDRLTVRRPAAAPASPVRREAHGAAVDARRAMVVIPGVRRPALRGVSASIAAGEAIAVVGESGSGKSTLARALAGVAPLDGGQVLVAGVEPAAMDPRERASLVGWMPQDVVLHPGSVAENIARFTDASPEEVHAAAEAAGVRAAIERLPGGFGFEVGPGGQALTPGLRQRVALARALFGSPALVILDQPTAHMDAEGEVATLNAIRALKGAGVTTVTISHKPVMAALADRILMMREGAVEHFESRERVIELMRRTIGPAGGPASAPAPAPQPAKEAAG
ncbi:ATP-binding cassette domain-containing protein [uncultured Albimonas sp.]|uniref:ATP-binding cassette domain-containing protein n=1 Tax=uncultured Albimonas sp. TaxID=1331701 RepID=UPI0030EBD27C